MTGIYIINQDFTAYEQYENVIGLAITLDKPYGKYRTQAQNDESISMTEFVELTRYALKVKQEKDQNND